MEYLISHRSAARLCTALGLALFICFSSASLWSQNAVPKRLPGAKGTDCTACHGTQSPLSNDHTPVADFAWTNCKGCHAGSAAASLTGKLSLSHVHLLSGVTCEKCHADVKKPEPVDAKVCGGCHEPSKVAEATTELHPTNPHNSPHYGQNIDCNLCHHQHSKSTNLCEDCHSEYKFNVP